jgi:Glucodextranase, domain B
MTTRRGARPTHVRPRPPSSGRPTPLKARPKAPQPTRIASHRPINRGAGLPVFIKLVLALAIVALGAGVLYVGAGGLRWAVGGLGTTLAGFVNGVTATPSPSPSVVAVSDAPILAAPDEPYTANKNVDLVITLPAAVVGSDAYQVRVYLALKDQQPALVAQQPVGDAQKKVVPVVLEKGINDFTVTILGPSGESDTSPVVRYVLDTAKPKVIISSPKNGAVVNAKKVTITGTVQARSILIARNVDNSTSITATAGSDGSFSLSLGLTTGTNHITIDATDPAGNVAEATLSVRRGTGKLTVVLTASDYSISRKGLPEVLKLTAEITDPNGSPLSGADVTFTLSIPGIPTITGPATSDSNGRATFTTTIPKGADLGQGSATVLVSSSDFGSTQDFTVISIKK